MGYPSSVTCSSSRQLLLKAPSGRGVGVAARPLRVTQALAALPLSGSQSWLGPQRVEQELLQSQPFPGEAKDKV
jgi:hypothetical protein